MMFIDAKFLTRDYVPKVDFHMHTTWTDGKHGVAEMHNAAIDAGLEKILFSEHARKTSVDWFSEFAAEVRGLPGDQCEAYVGLECKVEDFNGNVDTCPDITGHCDFVMASVHRFPDGEGGVKEFETVSKDESLDTEFRLSYEVLANPLVDVLGHPFGMSCKRFDIEPPDEMVGQLAQRCAQFNVAFEINSQYHDDPWRLIEICRESGSTVSLGSNAHSTKEVAEIIRTVNSPR